MDKGKPSKIKGYSDTMEQMIAQGIEYAVQQGTITYLYELHGEDS